MAPTKPNAPKIPFWTLGAATILLAAWLRLRGIDGPEPFVDEGANILTALDARVRIAFEPLAQGRPGLIWLFKPAGWWPEHALAVARVMSAGAGLATTALVGWILHQLAGRMAALCGMLLWAVMPVAVFHERLALQDPFVTALLAGAVALFTTGSLRSSTRFDWAWFAGAGVFFGVAFVLKISAALALPWLAIVYLAIRHHTSRPLIDRHLVYVFLGTLLPLAQLGTGLFSLGSKLGRYGALPLTGGNVELVPNLLERTQTWLTFYAGYGSWPLLILIVSGLVLAWIYGGKNRLALTCAVGWLIAACVTTVFYNNTYARYILSDHLPLILFLGLMAGQFWERAGKQRTFLSAVEILVLAGWSHTSWQIGTDPARASIPAKEISQYYTGPWSGRGLTGIKRFLTDYADAHKVRCLVMTHQFLRPGCYGLMLAELGDPRIIVQPFTIYEPTELSAIKPAMRKIESRGPIEFFILYEGSIYPPHPWLDASSGITHRVYEERRGAGESFTLYQIER